MRTRPPAEIDTWRRGYQHGQRDALGLAVQAVQQAPNLAAARREVKTLLSHAKEKH
ncbi:hypothetical protein [Paraburkholderia sacchari]|uniref:hypothetical protein n=1 Tax=Paraburkholderia sacchari TaxID=159450 RepID=UPI001BD010F4|nr:hypothetical protein [Paraburkholderia sacchari]